MNFNVSAVISADSKRAVKHKFHIARTRRLCTRERNLLGNFCGRHKDFGKRYTVIFEEHNLQFLADFGIVLNFRLCTKSS